MKSKHILTVFAVLALTSCSGTQIQLTEYVPAQFNMRRGATIGIGYKGSLSNKVAVELIRKIKQDGYYQLASSVHAATDYDIYLADMPEKINSIHCDVTKGNTNTVIYSNTMGQSWGDIGNAWKDFGKEFKSKFAGGVAPESRQEITLARKIYSLFAPHEQTYKERIETSSVNPDLEKAVLACKEQDWSTARTHTQSALQHYPQDAEAHFLMGLLERSESNFERSNEYFRRAQELAPDVKKYKSAIEKNNQMQKNETSVSNQLSD